MRTQAGLTRRIDPSRHPVRHFDLPTDELCSGVKPGGCSWKAAGRSLSRTVGALALAIAGSGIAQADSTPERVVETGTVYNVNTAAPTAWRPANDEIDRIVSFYDLFSNLRFVSGDGDAGYDLLGSDLRSQVDAAGWSAEARAAIEAHGPLMASQILRISWYPEDDPYGDGSVPIAVDFAGRTGNGSFICGYAIMTSLVDPANDAVGFAVHRFEQTAIAPDLLAGAIPRPDILAQLPCYLGPEIATAFGK